MSVRSRLTRLTTLALASCALTGAFAGSALAHPDANANVSQAPAFKAVQGDTGKGISERPPAFRGYVADANKTPNPAQVDRVLASLDNQKAKPQPAVDSSDNTDTVALVLAIAAILTALGAVALTITRTHRPMLGA
jgi:hypothetical protein